MLWSPLIRSRAVIGDLGWLSRGRFAQALDKRVCDKLHYQRKKSWATIPIVRPNRRHRAPRRSRNGCCQA